MIWFYDELSAYLDKGTILADGSFEKFSLLGMGDTVDTDTAVLARRQDMLTTPALVYSTVKEPNLEHPENYS